MSISGAILVAMLLAAGPGDQAPAPFRTTEYPALKAALTRGWNTWDTNSVLTHVLLPEGIALSLQPKSAWGQVLDSALIGRRGMGAEVVKPGPRSYDGSYTELTLSWRGIAIKVQTAAAGDVLDVLVTPAPGAKGSLILRPRMFYGRPGRIEAADGGLRAVLPDRTISIFVTGTGAEVKRGPAIEVQLTGPVGVATGSSRSLAEITARVEAARSRLVEDAAKYGDLRETHDAMQTVLAWNVIYEPTQDRVIVPVSRVWNVKAQWGGYVIFDWDSYFAAYMMSLDSRELAYAMAIEVTRAITPAGFVPNYSSAGNPAAGYPAKSLDRSQPPVGSLIVREIYRRFREEWFLREVFDDLLTWNRWWEANRQCGGYLCWGSNPYPWSWLRAPREIFFINNFQGAAWESGLDNSPMYDGVPFDFRRHMLPLADVGLMSFYVADCDALADIATILDRPEAAELRARAEKWRRVLDSLWVDEVGLYLNRRTDTGQFSRRISPTHFYPLLARVPDQARARRMIEEHLQNPDEFAGEYILPSIARNDRAFKDNIYWRGRIWAPMNFLVYLGLRNYDLPEARHELVAKSRALLLKSWRAEGHVYENYNAVSGVGDDVLMSDKFYHWGALLGFISFIENGSVPAPEQPLVSGSQIKGERLCVP